MLRVYTICATFTSSFVSLHLLLCGKRAVNIVDFDEGIRHDHPKLVPVQDLVKGISKNRKSQK